MLKPLFHRFAYFLLIQWRSLLDLCCLMFDDDISMFNFKFWACENFDAWWWWIYAVAVQTYAKPRIPHVCCWFVVYNVLAWRTLFTMLSDFVLMLVIPCWTPCCLLWGVHNDDETIALLFVSFCWTSFWSIAWSYMVWMLNAMLLYVGRVLFGMLENALTMNTCCKTLGF